MVFTYYPIDTDIGKLRLLIPDKESSDYIFADEELEAFLALEGDIRSAAALALETIAANQALVLKVMRLLDVQTDGARVAEVLMARAALLRKQAEEEAIAAGSGWDWAEMLTTDFAVRDRLVNEMLRES